ncbi:MAG: hypothetical protein ACI9DC_003895 [Gammaproteobacteria bacterium]|jgi:hypothetical protein
MNYWGIEMPSQPPELPCGTILKNRIIKSAMSDSLRHGRGNSTDVQIRLYERWANGGVAAMIIGEVQGSHTLLKNLAIWFCARIPIMPSSVNLHERVPPLERNSGFSSGMPAQWRILRSAPQKNQA